MSSQFDVRPLGPDTWPDFARLVEDHSGVWGGCWCLGFHESFRGSVEANRAAKEERVRTDRAHAALVFDGASCVGWCQFGPVDELPRIKHKRVYDQGLAKLPDWRITCFFTARGYRAKGVADAALGGALALIAAAGGGRVESYPQLIGDKKVSGSFLHNGTVQMFERHGFSRDRQLGKNHWVVTKKVRRRA